MGMPTPLELCLFPSHHKLDVFFTLRHPCMTHTQEEGVQIENTAFLDGEGKDFQFG